MILDGDGELLLGSKEAPRLVIAIRFISRQLCFRQSI